MAHVGKEGALGPAGLFGLSHLDFQPARIRFQLLLRLPLLLCDFLERSP